MKKEILAAAKSVLVNRGLAAWTIEDVAREAGCAKGLVNYHYKTKANLLAQVGDSLREDRIGRRLAALEIEGATALDALWNTLTSEVRTGELAAWLALSGVPDADVREGLRSREAELKRLEAAAGRAFGVSDSTMGQLIDSVLTGFQLALLNGSDGQMVRDAYHRFWLGVL
jgi:TetR/AcrR family transcriptional repressor of bet genes